MTMNKIQLQLLSFFFGALLPPKNNSKEDSYYTCLGVVKSSSAEDIRKAYKRKSLKYHPDKVAQFASAGNPKSEEEIQPDFVEVKEAYETLSDPRRRNAYDILGPEGAKYEEFDTLESMHNLARATIYNKTKLILLILFLSLIIVAGPTLIILRVDGSGGMKNVRWVLVLVPIWVLKTLLLLFTVASHRWFGTMQMMCIATGEVLLALRWDKIILWDYAFLFLPFFLHQFIILLKSVLEIKKVKKDLDRTVTVSFLEERVLPIYRDEQEKENNDDGFEVPQWCSYDSLTERERDIIHKEFIIINDPIDRGDNFSNESLDPETTLWFTIINSPEYERAMKVKFRAARLIALILSIRASFFFLLVFKLDQHTNWNWFLIFTPLWLEVSLSICSNCWTCCCYGVIREEEVDNNSEISMSEVNDKSGEYTVSEWIGVVPDNVDKSVDEKSAESPDDFHDNVDKSVDEISVGSADDFHSNGVAHHSRYEGKSSMEHMGSLWVGVDQENVDRSIAENSAGSQNNFRSNAEAYYPRYEGKASTEPDLDSDSIKKQVKASIWSVVYIIFAAFLTLLVVKLNKVDDEGDYGDRGYRAFWVAFPIFVVVGIILLCACSCVCCAAKIGALENTVPSKQFTGSEHIVEDIESFSDVTLHGNERDKIYVDNPDSDDLD